MKKMTDAEIEQMAGDVYPQLLAMAPKRANWLREQQDPDCSTSRVMSDVLAGFTKRMGWGDPPTNHAVYQFIRGGLFDENGQLKDEEVEATVAEAIGVAPASSANMGHDVPPQGTSSVPAPGAPPGSSGTTAAVVDGSSGSAPAPFSSPPPAVPPPARPEVPPAAQAMAALRVEMRQHFLERDGVIDSLLIAATAGEHLLLLGPPGTAKTALAKALARATSTTAFIRLLTRHTKTEEIFGPLSISDLREGRYVVLTEGYLPSAKVAVLDEIFKCNSAILNALLTITNEREYDNGRTRVRVPLHIVLGASNELPEDESLAALYDRFMFRHWVPAVSPANLPRLLAMKGAPEDKITVKVDLDALRALAGGTLVGPDVLAAILALRNKLATKEVGIFASDRRWRKAVALVGAAAVLRGAVTGAHAWNPDGTMTAIPADIAVLAHVLWDNPDDRPKVQSSVMVVIASARAAGPAPAPAPPRPAPKVTPPAPAPKAPGAPAPRAPTAPPASAPPPASPTAPGGAWGNIPQQALGGNNAPPSRNRGGRPGTQAPAAPTGPSPAQQRAQAAMRGQVQGDIIRDEIGGMAGPAAFSRIREFVQAGTAMQTLKPALEALARKFDADRTLPYANKRQIREWLLESQKPMTPPPAPDAALVPDPSPTDPA